MAWTLPNLLFWDGYIDIIPFNEAVVDTSEPFGIFIRLIPSATSLFDVSKLSLARNNVRAVSQGYPHFREPLQIMC